MADEVLCSIQDGIATLTLNRPEKRNAINQAMRESFTAHFTALEQHRDVRVVVIRGAGKVFCAGRDLREMGQQQQAEGTARSGVVELFHQLEALRHPTIAMVHGDALAGGGGARDDEDAEAGREPQNAGCGRDRTRDPPAAFAPLRFERGVAAPR